MQSAVHFQVPVALRHLFELPASSRLGTNSDRELFWTGNYFGKGTISDRELFRTPPISFGTPPLLLLWLILTERSRDNIIDPVGHPWGSCAGYLRNSFKWYRRRANPWLRMNLGVPKQQSLIVNKSRDRESADSKHHIYTSGVPAAV